MARRKGDIQSQQRHDIVPVTLGRPQVGIVRISVPTENPRHMSHIRYGRISAEVWSKENLAKIPVDPDVEIKVEGGSKDKGDARQVKETTKVPVREVREGVGEKASFQSSKAKARKRTLKKDSRGV